MCKTNRTEGELIFRNVTAITSRSFALPLSRPDINLAFINLTEPKGIHVMYGK